MNANTVILLVEAVLVVGLSSYVWFGVQSADEISTPHWAALFVLVLLLIAFAVTMYFNPLALK
ncbi:MAG: hypothetical protein ABEL51_03215 [Salinibacter sp.]